MKLINYFSLEFPSKSANESYARTAVAAFAAQLDPTLDEINDIKTAVSEAVTNAIVHAYPDTVGKVYIKARLFDANILEITVRDKGIGIENLERAREPLFTTGDESRSGMGFTIMESFVDKFRVKSAPGRGTVVVMQKRISIRLSNSRF